MKTSSCFAEGSRFVRTPWAVFLLALLFTLTAVPAWACDCDHSSGGGCCSGCGANGTGCNCCGTAGGSPVGVGGGQPYREPALLTSVDGVLEVDLILKQGYARFDTAASPVANALLFSYKVIRGSASGGKMEGSAQYPGPTLQVFPGETLIVHLKNELSGLTIRDYQNPTFTKANRKVPLYPDQLVNSPFNLHTHGLHVSPAGNGDNVILDIPSGMENTYTYFIPLDHPQGLYWYHTHRHMLTAPQTYRGLAGMLSIGRADGGIPSVTTNKLPVRMMAIQYNFVFNRKGGGAVMNNPYWPANVSTLNPQIPADQVANPPASLAKKLADGTYEPSLAPINFLDSPIGTQYFTAWWVGQLSVNNNRGAFQFVPSNLQTFTGNDGTVIPANPAMPDDQRDVQYTVNGQFQPVIKTPPGQTEIWVLGNFTDAGYVRVRIVNTETGDPIPLVIVGKDGNPVPNIQPALDDNGTVVLLEPATRIALAVTMPQSGGLRLEMPALTETGGTLDTPVENVGILYTNKGRRYSAVVGNLTMDPAVISYMDGFFYYPTQTLLTAEPNDRTGTTVNFTIGQPLGAYTSFVDLSGVTPDVKRELVITGGFKNENASPQDPNAFAYQFDGNQFPYIPILQPRLNTSEQWTFFNRNNDQHPIHIHVNDYQIHEYSDPVANVTYTDLQFGADNQNCPAPLYDSSGNNVLASGKLSVRTEFKDFIGAYVFHCHRLNHEDNGLMAMVNVIPEVTAYAYAETGAATPSGTTIRPTEVVVINQDTRQELARVRPFGEDATTPVDVAMGDVDGDMILDLIVGGGPGMAPIVKVFNGASNFEEVIFKRTIFAPSFRGGVRVASANIDGTQNGDNVVVGSGPGMKATVVVLPSGPENAGTEPFFSQWYPYGNFKGGVDVDAGLVTATGRNSIVTAPGAGGNGTVKVYYFSLYTPLEGHNHSGHGHDAHTSGEPVAGEGDNLPELITSFVPFPGRREAGLRVATGWVAGREGGFSRVVVGQETRGNRVAVFTSGSRLNGHPELYVQHDIDAHSASAEFLKATEFEGLPGSAGIDVATSANPISADLVVSGNVGGRGKVMVYDLLRPTLKATQVVPKLLYEKSSLLPISASGGR